MRRPERPVGGLRRLLLSRPGGSLSGTTALRADQSRAPCRCNPRRSPRRPTPCSGFVRSISVGTPTSLPCAEPKAASDSRPSAAVTRRARGESRVSADLRRETSRRAKAGLWTSARHAVARTRRRRKAGVSERPSRRPAGRSRRGSRCWRKERVPCRERGMIRFRSWRATVAGSQVCRFARSGA